MSSRKRVEILGQDALNEIGQAMAAGLDKAKLEAWNGALCALVLALEEAAKLGEMTTIASVVDVARGMMHLEPEA